MSGTLSFQAGQVFVGTTPTAGDTGEVALTEVGNVTFSTLNPPTIANVTITQDIAASDTSTSLGLVNVSLESVTIDSVNTAASVTLTSADLPTSITIPPGFTLPQVVQGTVLDVTVLTNEGDLTGQVGVYGVSGTLALVAVQDLSALGFTFDLGAAVLSLGPQATGAVSDSFTPSFAQSGPCFAEGTRIATPQGARPVESLAAGDPVCLASGDVAPITWVGHRAVRCDTHPRPEDVWPVRVCAHAFGLGRPARDLLLSPDHAVFVDDVLIPIRYLLNDATVRQIRVARVRYWHLELAQHSVVLAEGLPAESYLDTGNRAAFANGGAVAMAQPDFARRTWAARGAAPLVTAGSPRDAVYRRLIAQALTLGWRATPKDGAPGSVRWQPPATYSQAKLAARSGSPPT